MYIVKAKSPGDSYGPDIQGGDNLRWIEGQTRLVHEGVIQFYRSNPIAWEIVDSDDSLVRATANPVTGGIELIGPGGDVITQDALGFASGPVGYVDRPLNVAGMTNFVGNSTWATGWTGVRTTHLKVEAEAPFSAVRVWIGIKSTSGTAPVFKALLGVTETGAINTVNNAFLPVRSGTVYNVTQDASGRGWKSVTWGGNATGSVAFPASGTNSAQYACSDWMPINSVDRADVPGGRPMALLRIAQTDASAPMSSLLSGSVNVPLWDAAAGEPWHRVFAPATVSNNGVDTLTNIPSTTEAAMMMCWLEFKYDAPTRSVIVVGDSTHECSGQASAKFNNWTRIGIGNISTQFAPVSLANFGASGHSQAQFNVLLDNIVSAGARPTDVIYQGWSQNGFTHTAAGLESYLGETLRRIETLRGLGITVWLSTGYAANGYSAASNALRNQCNAKVRAWAAAGIVRLIDIDAVVSVDDGDGTSSIRADYDSGDGIHANAAGISAMAAELERVWS